MGEAIEEPGAGAGTHLCLEVCPECRENNYKGGACHLPAEHADQHECSAVSGAMHRWR